MYLMIVTLIFDGTGLLAECENVVGEVPDDLKKKANSWVLDCESLLRDGKGEKYVNLFRADAGIPLPFGRFGESEQAKLCHHIRSRLKNLKIISMPHVRLR
jgi:hypothetical protein